MDDLNLEQMRHRLVRYQELVGCQEAFLDRRIDGRAGNENFTIIGPGVAESAQQHVHISIPHGFNIGAARQQPHAINSQHSHDTAEVFVVHTGRWAFRTGVRGDDAEVELGPGDIISVPTQVFRGFENVSGEQAFLFAVLGGDDPGRVTWAPDVFEKAGQTGLVLLEDGSLIDTTRGERIPDGLAPMTPTTEEQAKRLRRVTVAELAGCVQRASELEAAGDSLLTRNSDAIEYPIIGDESSAERVPAGRMNWSHGFSLRCMYFPPGASIRLHARDEEEVLFAHAGTLSVHWADGNLDLAPGDVLSVPPGLRRRFVNESDQTTMVYVVHRHDRPAPPRFD